MNNRHPEGEMNFILPLTSHCGNTASTWVESLPFLGDYHPIPMEHGNVVFFDGNRCRHFNKPNTELPACTRVSFDFRAMTRESYALTVEHVQGKEGVESFTTNRKFVIGSYYTTMSVDAGGAAAAEAWGAPPTSPTTGEMILIGFVR